MRLFRLALRRALRPGATPGQVIAWAFYDFANSGYSTVVLTTVFTAYFVGQVAVGHDWATFAMTCALSVSYGITLLILPRLGAWADARAGKQRILRWSTVACVVLTAMLSTIQPGDIFWALLLLALSNIAFCVGETMNSAFLPDLARPSFLGRVSGWGWGLGYAGGMLTLGLGLAWVTHATAQGKPATDYVPGVMWITALVFLVAALPALAWLRDRSEPRSLSSYSVQAPACGAPTASHTFSLGDIRSLLGAFPDFFWLLVCGALYHAGIAVVITLSAVYATQAMGFDTQQTMLLIFLVNAAAAAGALCFGHLQDRLGHQRSMALTLSGWVLMVLLASLSSSSTVFWIAAFIAGLCMGTSQSAGRVMVAALAPAGLRTRFYALWSWSVRFASIVGPIVYGVVVWVSAGNHRMALLITGLFFVISLWALKKINFHRGVLARDRMHP